MVKSFKFFHGVIGGKLTAVWTPQMHEDLNGLNVETELTRLMSEQISEEIDREIIDRLISEATDNIEHTTSYLNYWLNIGNNRA